MMVNVCRLAFVAGLALIGVVHAAECTSTSFTCGVYGGSTGNGSSQEAACAAAVAAFTAANATSGVFNMTLGARSSATTFITPLSNKSNGSFVVNQVATVNTAVCTAPVDKEAECAAVVAGLNYLKAPLVHYGAVGLTACFGGYVVSGSGGASGGGQSELYGPFKCSGASATACAVIPKSSSITVTCPDGQYPGTVNGVQVCSPPSNTITSPTNTTATPPTAGASAPAIPNAPAGTTSATEQTACADGTCTTTTQFKDASGNPLGSTTKDKPITSFCQENPKAPGCKEVVEGTFGGSCGAFTCTGDAVQCALTKEVYKQNCLLNATTSESALYDTAKTKTGDVTATLPGNSTVNIGSASFDTSDSIGGKACIGDVTGTVFGATVTLPFGTYVCPHAQNLRLILLALGFIIGYVVIARRA